MPNENAAVTVNDLNANQKKALQALRQPVTNAARQFAQVRERLTDLAPKIVRLYTQIQAEHERFTFVDFARLFDATIPTHAADRDGTIGYRNHRVYYTLTYMRRLVQTGGGQRRGQQGVRDSATDGLARTLATLLQIVPDAETVWNAIQTEFGFTERLMTRLRKRVDATQPLFKLDAPKPVKVGKVLHMTPATAANGNGEPMAQPGQRVEEAAAQGRKKAA